MPEFLGHLLANIPPWLAARWEALLFERTTTHGLVPCHLRPFTFLQQPGLQAG
jgi:hypothetical protein